MVDVSIIKGIVVPMVTPIDKEENVDVAGLKRLIHYLLNAGVHGIFPLGTTGESVRLDDEQKKVVAEITIKEVNKKIPVYLGVSDSGTRRVIKNIRVAERLGADLLVCTLPFYYPVKDLEEQSVFWETVLSSTELPVMLYNIPDLVGAEILPEAIAGILFKPNLVGIKDSSPKMDSLQRYLRLKERKPDFKVFVGHEFLNKDGLMAGADGLVPSLGNVLPKFYMKFYEASLHKNESELNLFQEQIDSINQFNLGLNSGLRGVIYRKIALKMLGISSEDMTSPCLKVDPGVRAEFEQRIRKFLSDEIAKIEMR